MCVNQIPMENMYNVVYGPPTERVDFELKKCPLAEESYYYKNVTQHLPKILGRKCKEKLCHENQKNSNNFLKRHATSKQSSS